MTAESGLESRVSRLEGGYEHVATKADLIATQSDIAGLRAKVEILQWGVGLLILLNVGVLVRLLTLGDF